MKTGSKVSLVLAALLAAGSVWAADVDGKWVGKVGEQEIVFTLKADGEKLTGTLNNAAAAGETEIKEGKIVGNAISFHVVRTLQETETKVQWTGTLAGDEIKFKRGAAGGTTETEVVAKRSK